MTAAVPTDHAYPRLTPAHVKAFTVIDAAQRALDHQPAPGTVQAGALGLMHACALLMDAAERGGHAFDLDEAWRTLEVRFEYLAGDVSRAVKDGAP